MSRRLLVTPTERVAHVAAYSTTSGAARVFLYLSSAKHTKSKDPSIAHIYENKRRYGGGQGDRNRIVILRYLLKFFSVKYESELLKSHL